jgi:hypothetical protein
MIIEELLPEKLIKEYNTLVTSYDFPWYWQENQIGDLYGSNQVYGFTHLLYSINIGINSEHYNFFIPIISAFKDKSNLKIKSLIRFQVNLLTSQNVTEIIEKNQIHIDNENNNYYSFILYLMDSDGNTNVYDSQEGTNLIDTCEPKLNRCFWFKSNQWHSATLPKINKKRIVINCIVELENDKV